MATDPYDLLPYECRAVSHTHPARLATAALLKGRECAPPARCRMLELGCGDATNLLPLAVSYPESRFVGVDRSAVMIDAGRRVVRELRVTNVELVCADIAELGAGIGPFDYVVAHGVFSWVSDAARERMVAIFAEELSEAGVGYLSYNAQPGWGIRGYLRDLLLLHTRGIDDVAEKVRCAREHLARLHALRVGGAADPYAELLAQMIGALLERSDGYLLHEYLAEHNRAFSIVEMMDVLEARGLRILDDLVRATVDEVSHDMLEVQLYRDGLPAREVEAAGDLLTFRQLRASLIGRDAPLRVPSPQRIFESCEMAAALRPLDLAPWDADQEQRFETRQGAAITAKTPLLRAALTLLGDAYPASMRPRELLERGARLLAAHMPEPPELKPEDAEEAFLDLMRLRGLGFVELRAHPMPLVTRIGERPAVSPLTRIEAARGRPVTNALHEPVALDATTAAVVALLDGTRDVAAIAEALGEGERRSPEQVRELVRAALRGLARSGLLVS